MSKAGKLVDAVNRLQQIDEEWEARIQALHAIRSLVSEDPGLIGELDAESSQLLVVALSKQVKDLRSMVVKETCATIQFLSEMCGFGMRSVGGGLLTALVDATASANRVISGYVFDSIMTLLRHVQVRNAVPVLGEVIKTSKAPSVREMCLQALQVIFDSYDVAFLEKNRATLESIIRTGLVDASHKARAAARQCFFGFAENFSETADRLYKTLDQRTQKLLDKESRDPYSSNVSLRSSSPYSMRTAPVGYGDGSVYGDDESIGGGALSEIASISGVDTESVISTKSNGPGKPRRLKTRRGSGNSAGAVSITSTPAAPSSTRSMRLPRSLAAPRIRPGRRNGDGWKPQVGERVRADLRGGSKEGICQYVGPVPWGSGVWVGMELDTKEGKNDGSVTYRPFGGKRQTKRFFQCEPDKGLFVRLAHIFPASSHGEEFPTASSSAEDITTPTAAVASNGRFQASAEPLLLTSVNGEIVTKPLRSLAKGKGRKNAWDSTAKPAEAQSQSSSIPDASSSWKEEDSELAEEEAEDLRAEGGRGIPTLTVGPQLGRWSSELLAQHRQHLDELLEGIAAEMDILEYVESVNEKKRPPEMIEDYLERVLEYMKVRRCGIEVMERTLQSDLRQLKAAGQASGAK